MKPFNREKFLLYLLAGIFAYQAAVFTYGMWVCSHVTPKQSIQQVCPELGSRYDQTFAVMIATTLALLTGGAAVLSTNQSSRSSGDERDKRDPSGSPRPQRPVKPPEQPPEQPTLGRPQGKS